MDTFEAVLARRIGEHVRVLVDAIGARPPGSPANRRATEHVVDTLEAAGMAVECQEFEATWWTPGRAGLCVGGRRIDVPPAPFGRPFDGRGPVTRRSTDADLARPILPGSVVVLDGDLAAEPYFPKAFPFLELPEQRARLDRLEEARPAAVVLVAPSRGPMAHLEDGDLTFPYLVVDPHVGDLLREGEAVEIAIGGALQVGTGWNVSARTGVRGPRSILCAHVDSKVTTPGAIDNAGGVATLLAVAESRQLAGHAMEFVVFNGEDHYAAPGEQVWLASADLASVEQVLNLDGVGARDRATTVAGLALPEQLEGRLRALVGERPGFEVVPPWYESDHAMFAMRAIPSLALTCAAPHELVTVLHGPADTSDGLDVQILAAVGTFVRDWLA